MSTFWDEWQIEILDYWWVWNKSSKVSTFYRAGDRLTYSITDGKATHLAMCRHSRVGDRWTFWIMGMLGNFWSLYWPNGVDDRSTRWHIESWICREHLGQSVDLMGWVTSQQVDILNHEWEGNIVIMSHTALGVRGEHLVLLWFCITSIWVGICVHPSISICLSVPVFLYIIFPIGFSQCLSISQTWWPWARPWIH